MVIAVLLPGVLIDKLSTKMEFVRTVIAIKRLIAKVEIVIQFNVLQ